jgi:hypothetical protein
MTLTLYCSLAGAHICHSYRLIFDFEPSTSSNSAKVDSPPILKSGRWTFPTPHRQLQMAQPQAQAQRQKTNLDALQGMLNGIVCTNHATFRDSS